MMRQHHFFVHLLFILSGPAWSEAPLWSVWKEGLTAYRDNNFEQAVNRFEHWIRLLHAEGTESSEAYLNLGLSHFKQENFDHATVAFLKSMEIGNHPIRNLGLISVLQRLQDALGFKESAVGRWDFYLWSMVKKTFAIGLFMLGTLLFQIWIILYIFLKRRYHSVRYMVWGPSAMIAASGGLFLLTYFAPRIGVIVSPLDNAFLFKNSTLESSESLVEIPSGTVMVWEGEQGEAIRVNFPLSGWVGKDFFQKIGPL